MSAVLTDRVGVLSGARRARARGGVVASGSVEGACVRVGVSGVQGLQRARILRATLGVVAERGGGSVSVVDIVARSGISRRTFYDVFEDREECFLACFDSALSLCAERVMSAFGVGGRWRDRVREGLVALLCFLDEQPQLARVLLVESLAMGQGVLERRERTIEWLVGLVDEGRLEGRTGRGVSWLTAEGIVGGVLSILRSTLTNGEAGSPPLVGLVNPLMGMVVMPYLGHAASSRELDRPIAPAPVPSPARVESGVTDPFRRMGLRVTYRTVRVLLAISENPGASNRAIGESAGIRDQGQISKLLGRLGRLGLIDNQDARHAGGAANAWRLTSMGQQAISSIGAHTGPINTPGGQSTR